jgi:RimJ/RimL family protein N-acetyltransferase
MNPNHLQMFQYLLNSFPMKIAFRPIRSEDFQRLNIWLSSPHVAEVWDHPQYEEPYEQYVFRSNDGSVEQFIIEADAQPVGYFQFYWASRVGDGWWEGYDDATVGIDFYVGETEWLGKGLGQRVIEEAKATLFANPKIERIIADPSPTNKRIIHLLNNAGFRSVGEIKTPDGQALLMEIRRN